MKLKNNFEIACNDHQCVAFSNVLVNLGYRMYSDFESMDGWMCLATTDEPGEIQRGYHSPKVRISFSDIGDFLVWHFTPEKSEAEKELDSLQQKMSELQAQMDKLKEVVTKEKQK